MSNQNLITTSLIQEMDYTKSEARSLRAYINDVRAKWLVETNKTVKADLERIYFSMGGEHYEEQIEDRA